MILNSNIFKIKKSNTKPHTGCLLISEPFLSEVYFQKSVIMIVEYDINGGMGLILNKPLELILNDLIVGLDDIQEIPIFCGGPVARDRLFYIHNLGDLIPGSIKIAENLYIDGDFETILSYLRNGNKIEGNIKFFLGYSGWDEEQLDKEIEDNTWIVTNNKGMNLLKPYNDMMWKDAILSLDGKYKHWLNFPQEPFLN